jgi:hypothetical protein
MNEKLDIGAVLQRIFETYRSQFTLLLSAALVVFLPVALLTGVILSGGGLVLILLVGLLILVASFWYQGMVVEAARDMLDGRRDHTLGSLFSSVTPVVGPLLAAGLLAGIAITIGTALLLIPGLFLRTIWAVLAPAVVLERRRVFAAFGRSRELVRGHGWQVFGVILVVFLLEWSTSLVSRAIGSDSDAIYAVIELVRTVLLAPVAGLAAAILYFELKRLHGQPVLEGVAPSAGTPSSERISTPSSTPSPTAGDPGTTPPPPAGSPGAPPPPPGDS